MKTTIKRSWVHYITLFLSLFLAGNVFAQDLEPRRWTHMPNGLNVVSLALGYGEGDNYFDPVLQMKDVEIQHVSTGFVYVRTLNFFGRSARIDAIVPYTSARWEGLLEGQPASTRRRGFGDPRFRLSVLLYGGPSMTPKEFSETPRSNTVVGAALGVKVPWGEYYKDRLINLGENRLVIKPQVGVTHTRGNWTYELTGSLFWYDDNDNFWNGGHLENDLLYAVQGHVIYTFRPGLWASLSTAYGTGWDTTVNEVEKELEIDKWITALSVGIPINRQQGLKVAWVRSRTQNDTGSDMDSINVGWSYIF